MAFLVLLVCALGASAERVGNDTINIPLQSATAGGELFLRDAFPGLQFDKPVAIRTVPGTNNRVFVAERFGRIMLIDNFSNPSTRVFLDIRDRVFASDWINDRRAEGLTSFAFHPKFQENGRFFVTYTTVTTTSQGTGHHNRLSEFRISTDGNGNPDSEIPLITQFDEGDGHNINDIHFGPDGYLYISSGDEGDGGRGDDFQNAQKIDKDFFSAILRIDVDKRSGSLPPNPHPASSTNYAIPADNPYVGLENWQGKQLDRTKVRDEFFAVGLRNPWRFSFDPLTGEIYEGDVGQHGREEINRISKGGNYGWSYREGNLVGPAGQPPEGLLLTPPLFQYSTGFGHFEGFSVTGGVVYRGDRLPTLYGLLVFADFVSGNIWTMNIDQAGSAPKRILGEVGIAGFGYDPQNGDVLLVNHDKGIIQRLDISTGGGVNLPLKLSETGLFSDLASLTPHRGIYPFEVNLPFWSDGAAKRRWFSIPDLSKKMTFSAEANWGFPSGSYFIKHFDLETIVGNPASNKRIETRVLIKNDAGAYGITYKWNDAGTDAELVAENGATNQFAITEAGQTRQQSWIFPSRQECMGCHTTVGGLVLGFNTAQLNRKGGFAPQDRNQLEALSLSGFFENAPTNYSRFHALARLDDTNVSRTFRVKSYLAANCSFCHQPDGSARGKWDGRITTPLSKANIINATLFNITGDGADRVVVPGDSSKSALLKRLQATDRDRMPPVGSTVHDQAAIAMLSQWINQDLESYETFEVWAARALRGQTAANAAPTADPDSDGLPNESEYLLSTDPLSPSSRYHVSAAQTQGAVTYTFTQPAHRSILIQSAEQPLGPWRYLQAPDNNLNFPAAPLDRTLTLPPTAPQQYFRFQIAEP